MKTSEFAARTKIYAECRRNPQTLPRLLLLEEQNTWGVSPRTNKDRILWIQFNA